MPVLGQMARLLAQALSGRTADAPANSLFSVLPGRRGRSSGHRPLRQVCNQEVDEAA